MVSILTDTNGRVNFKWSENGLPSYIGNWDIGNQAGTSLEIADEYLASHYYDISVLYRLQGHDYILHSSTTELGPNIATVKYNHYVQVSGELLPVIGDFFSVTILYSDTNPGIGRVLSVASRWHDVPSIPSRNISFEEAIATVCSMMPGYCIAVETTGAPRISPFNNVDIRLEYEADVI
jgi:hypothetical protein